jgi:hypothetical protein
MEEVIISGFLGLAFGASPHLWHVRIKPWLTDQKTKKRRLSEYEALQERLRTTEEHLARIKKFAEEAMIELPAVDTKPNSEPIKPAPKPEPKQVAKNTESDRARKEKEAYEKHIMNLTKVGDELLKELQVREFYPDVNIKGDEVYVCEARDMRDAEIKALHALRRRFPNRWITLTEMPAIYTYKRSSPLMYRFTYRAKTQEGRYPLQ